MNFNSQASPVLLLQGPVGSFFSSLSRSLERSGFSVVNVNFNLGDWLYRRGKNAVFFRDDLDAWRDWLTALCTKRRPLCIMMFGDCRPIHVVARQVAENFGVRVFCFEEGYLRPNYVTFEEGGNNANSLFTCDPHERFAPEPERPVTQMRNSFWRVASLATAYQAALQLGGAFYPGYLHHRSRFLRIEAMRWARAGARKMLCKRKDARLIRSLLRDNAKRYFIVALQVADDLQIFHHGCGWTQTKLIVSAIQSFAAKAPADAQLVIRCHPMDCGNVGYRELIDKCRREQGVADRVHLIYTGHGPTLLKGAAGLVTINSTMAIGALAYGCPVFAFGEAIYRVQGLLFEGSDIAALSAFWRSPLPTDPNLFQRFVAELRRQTQINGSYYESDSFDAMSAQIIARLTENLILVDGSAIDAADSQARSRTARKANSDLRHNVVRL